MISTRMWRAIGIGGTAVTGALLLGVTKIVDVEVSTNLFNTGITVGSIFGVLMVIISIAIYKNLA